MLGFSTISPNIFVIINLFFIFLDYFVLLNFFQQIANHESINWKAESRVGSLVNAGHVPGGGNVHV